MIELLTLTAVLAMSAGVAVALQVSALRLLLRAMQPGAPAHRKNPGERS
jgi:hypothetical protein